MSRHTISNADQLFAGAGLALGLNDGKRGVQISPPHLMFFNAPIAEDPNGIVAAAATPSGAVTLNGALVTDGVAVLDYARTLIVDSSAAGDTTQTVTLTGTDITGEVVVEDIDLNGTTAVEGAKAFKTITAASVSAAMAGNLDVGTTDSFGLDALLIGLEYTLFGRLTGVVANDGTFTAADSTTPVTNTTNDRRGLYSPATNPNGSNSYLVAYIPDLSANGYGNDARN